MALHFRRGLRVLMYHKVSVDSVDRLTVTAEQLEQQLRWLQQRDYQFVTTAEVIAASMGKCELASRSVLATFDDAYDDTLQVAQPVLERCRARAIVFVPTAFVGKTSSWDANAAPLMSTAQLKKLADFGWELGWHSHQHFNYGTASADEIERDLRDSGEAFRAMGLGTVPALAYPYGGRPKEAVRRDAMYDRLRAHGLKIAFRIGGRINRLPLSARHPFELNRIGVRGDRSFGAFTWDMRFGRLLG
jgi:peptidoglycan/xylan/chitin deacetylase (PgdA/CDA1 family)